MQFLIEFAWVTDHRPHLEAALQIVEYVLNVKAGSEIKLDGTHSPIWIHGQQVILTEQKVTESIQHICALSTLDHDRTTALLTAAKHYLDDNPQYAGDNLTYHRIITEVALACGDDSVVASYGSRRFRHLLTKKDYEAILKDPFLLEHIDNVKLRQSFQAELDHILSEPLSDELMGILPIIQQWGSEAQAKRYAEQRDKYYLDKFAQMLAEPSSENAIDDCIHHLKQLNETFPQSVSGHYELQALVSETANETWQKGKQHLVNAYGDQTNQQSYRLLCIPSKIPPSLKLVVEVEKAFEPF